MALNEYIKSSEKSKDYNSTKVKLIVLLCKPFK